MQPRTLDQILGELNSVYQPQIDNIQKQQGLLPGQTDAAINQAGAAKDTAFGDILNGARERGMGFSGIPLSEQAKYASNVYAPAVLQAKTDAQNKALSLQDAINQINTQKYNQGQTMFTDERNFAEQQREFDANLAQQRAAAAAALSASPTFGFTGSPTTGQAPAAADPYSKIDKNSAYKSVQALMNTGDTARINREYNAIKASAGYGNVFDQYKLGLLNSFSTPSKTSAYDPRYATLLKQALAYKAPATPAPKVIPTLANPGYNPLSFINPLALKR